MYCVKELKLSETSAWRKICAMRLLKEIPEIESKIQSGDLNLTQLSLARSHFKEVKASIQEKKEILLSLENQSTRSTERILAENKPEGFMSKPIEKENALRGQKIELTLVLDEDFQKELEEIEFLSGKKYSKLELFKLMTKATLERLRKKSAVNVSNKTEPALPDEPDAASKIASVNSSSEVGNEFANEFVSGKERKAQPAPQLAVQSGLQKTRYISAATRKFVRVRDQGKCQYVDPISKRQCEAKHYIQFDHQKAFAKGGANTAENLQLLCSTHNKLRAVQVFGPRNMQRYLPLLR